MIMYYVDLNPGGLCKDENVQETSTYVNDQNAWLLKCYPLVVLNGFVAFWHTIMKYIMNI